MNSDVILAAIEASWLGELVRNVTWLFAAGETVHFVGLSLLLGAMLIVDLRLLGLLRGIPIRYVLPLTNVAVLGFAMNLVTGVMFFASNPLMYYPNPAFRLKMFLVALAGLNVVAFELFERRVVMTLPDNGVPAFHTRLVGGISLLLWFAIIAFGRLLPTFEGATSFFI